MNINALIFLMISVLYFLIFTLKVSIF